MNTKSVNKRELPSLRGRRACREGVIRLRSAEKDRDLMTCFWKYLDFCLVRHYPGVEWLQDNRFPAMAENGLFFNRKWKVCNPDKTAILGRSDFEIVCNGYIVSRIYVADTSRVDLVANENSFVMIDVLDDARVNIERSSNARVIVTLYGNGECFGNPSKINRTNKRTYDL